MRKDTAAVDLWLKEIAPSRELRQWYSHDHERWEAFQSKYRSELDTRPEDVERLKQGLKRSEVPN